MKGNPRKGIEPTLWDVPEDHDPSSKGAAYDLLQRGGLPVGVVYQEENRPALEQRVEHMWDTARARSADELMAAFEF